MIMAEGKPVVSIGMPVYNGERFISETLDSLLAQSYQDFELIISDNASIDSTIEICKDYASSDQRVRYHRNDANIGAAENFKRVFDLAHGRYFMWAAADDCYEPCYVETCVTALRNNKDIGMVFSNMVTIDSFGRVIRDYPDFSRFAARSGFMRVLRFVKDPEILGKACLIYSLYRTEVCRQAWSASALNDTDRGSDMGFVLAAIGRSRVHIDNRVLFRKRCVRDSDRADKVSRIEVDSSDLVMPMGYLLAYARTYLKAVRGTRYYPLVLALMGLRVARTGAGTVFGVVKSQMHRTVRLVVGMGS